MPDLGQGLGFEVSPLTSEQYTETANRDNFQLPASTFIRVADSTASHTYTGFVAEAPGTIHILAAVGPNSIGLENESGASTAANRILTWTGNAVNLGTAAACLLIYDGTASRWRAYTLGAVDAP